MTPEHQTPMEQLIESLRKDLFLIYVYPPAGAVEEFIKPAIEHIANERNGRKEEVFRFEVDDFRKPFKFSSIAPSAIALVVLPPSFGRMSETLSVLEVSLSSTGNAHRRFILVGDRATYDRAESELRKKFGDGLKLIDRTAFQD